MIQYSEYNKEQSETIKEYLPTDISKVVGRFTSFVRVDGVSWVERIESIPDPDWEYAGDSMLWYNHPAIERLPILFAVDNIEIINGRGAHLSWRMDNKHVATNMLDFINAIQPWRGQVKDFKMSRDSMLKIVVVQCLLGDFFLRFDDGICTIVISTTTAPANKEISTT